MKTLKELMKIDSWEKFCEETKRDPNNLPDVSSWKGVFGNDNYGNALTAEVKLALMINWGNVEEDLSYENSDQEKWTPWLIIDKDPNNPSLSAFRLSAAGCEYEDTSAILGARLPAATEDVVKWICTAHIGLVNQANQIR